MSHYSIVYTGNLLPGVERESALRAVAKLFNLDPEKADAFLNKKDVVVKKDLDRTQAQQYESHLKHAGLDVYVREQMQAAAPQAAAEIEDPAEAVESDSAPTAAKAKPREVTGEPEKHQFKFSGVGGEYFSIWIVNILLTIVTLGLYSPWAKVRNLQYFYGNTEVASGTFQFHAKPIQILKGRLIAIGVFIVISIVQSIEPITGIILGLALLPAIPWLIIRSMAFNLRNTSYRNVRFNFKAGYWDAALVFVFAPLLLFITFGLAAPYIWYLQSKFIVDHSYYGTTKMDFRASASQYYTILVMAIAISIGAIILGFLIGLLLGGLSSMLASDIEGVGAIVSVIGAVVGYMVVYIWAGAYIQTSVWNLHFNESAIDNNRFEATLPTSTMMWFYFKHTFLILLTVGLYIPWAKINLANLRADSLKLVSHEGVDYFVDGEREKVSALGDELGDVFDIDFSPI